MNKVMMPLPNSDAYREISTPEALNQFVENYGPINYKVERTDHRGVQWLVVKEFEEGRKSYLEGKVRDCRIWGCE